MNKKTLDFLLVAFIVIETLCYTYLRQIDLYYTTSILYFAAGLGICYIPLFVKVFPSVAAKRNFFLPVVFSVVILVPLLFSLIPLFKQVPLDYHLADMLPRIKIYADRFMHGRYVYDDVKEIWGGGLPPYFPATWAPYIPANIWGFDMRWVTLAFIVLAVFLTLLFTKWRPGYLNTFLSIVLLIGLFLLFNFHNYWITEIWTMTYEGLIAAYYLLLCLAIISGNPYLIGCGISLCLLSRFSLAFWVPSFLLFLWWKESFGYAAKTAATITILILTLFILPFVVGHLDIFLKTLDQYRKGSENFWIIFNIDNKEYKEVGLYKFFYSSQLQLLRKIQLATSILTPMFLLFFAGRFVPFFKAKNKLIGLCSLKITLLFFYNFIEMPFHYLFITPTIISYAIGFFYLSLEEGPPSISTADA